MVDIVGNGHVQAPSDGVGQGLYEESSGQLGRIGAIRELNDGRRFRYAYFASAAAAGVLVSQDLSATAVAVQILNKATAAAIGATQVVLTDATTLGSATKDQYAGAYLHTCDEAGEGYTYRIIGNTAASSNAVTFSLYDPLVIALTTASDVAITGSLWYKVVAATAAADYVVSGVTTRVMQAEYYGWVQTKGVCTILCDGTPAVGAQLQLSDGVAGAVQLKDSETEPLIGQATFLGIDGNHIGVRLFGLE